jgi:ParB family chromosome partitioning protein
MVAINEAHSGKSYKKRLSAPNGTGFAPRISLQECIRRLESERVRGMVLLRLDPKTIGHSQYANRHPLSLQEGDANWEELKASIRTQGQDEPVRVRPAPPGSPYEYELVYGHRRHAVCLQLDQEMEDGFPILARLDAQATDARDHVLKMYRENKVRADLSAFETGTMFLNWLQSEVFTRQSEIAKAIDASEVTVLKYIQLATLPQDILAAFGDPRMIALRWGQDILRALKLDAALVMARAQRLARAATRPAAETIFRALIERPETNLEDGSSREEVVKVNGRVVFRVMLRDRRLTLRYADRVDKSLQGELADTIKGVVEQRLKAALYA